MTNSDAPALFRKAVAFHNQGRFEDALVLYDAVLRLTPGYAAAHSNRGFALHSLNRMDEALESYDRAIGLNPNFADAYNNKGIALQELQRWPEALQSYDAAIRLKPGSSDLYNNRGVTLQNLQRFEDALQSYDRAIELDPKSSLAFNNRGVTLKDLNRMDEALLSHERAIELNPRHMVAHNNKGIALTELKRTEEALQCFDRAIGLKPDYAEAYYNRGNALRALHRPDDALQSFDRAIELRPDYVDAHWNRSTCTLSMGRFAEGWRLYEWRKKRFSPEVSRDYPQPVWLGEEDIKGKTLFVYAEQGLGDTIQFCRYAQLAEAKGANVIFAVQDELIPLLGKLTDGITITGWKAPPPLFDLQTSLLSMPLAFGTDENNIPATVPYLQPGPDLVAKWRKFLGNDGYKVGICWQGKKDTPIDKGRSIPLRCLEGLSKIPNLRLISLQKNDGVEQLRGLPPGMKVETLGENFDAGPGAFVDTAAVMESLDLVVTTDTAIAHLAGALARPVWVALKHVPEWRWLLGRADSPWYPTMKLFRQPTDDDWRSVFAAMETELAKRTGSAQF